MVAGRGMRHRARLGDDEPVISPRTSSRIESDGPRNRLACRPLSSRPAQPRTSGSIDRTPYPLRRPVFLWGAAVAFSLLLAHPSAATGAAGRRPTRLQFQAHDGHGLGLGVGGGRVFPPAHQLGGLAAQLLDPAGVGLREVACAKAASMPAGEAMRMQASAGVPTTMPSAVTRSSRRMHPPSSLGRSRPSIPPATNLPCARRCDSCAGGASIPELTWWRRGRPSAASPTHGSRACRCAKPVQ
jgi:hypothetical protein